MDIKKAAYEFNRIDEISNRDIWINKIDPSIKIVVTLFYLFRVLLINNVDMLELFILVLYPAIIFIFGKIKIKIIVRKLWLLMPLIVGIGIVNLTINLSYAELLNTAVVLIKGILCLTAGILLIVTTGINNLTLGLRKIKLPKILIIQIEMLYRYIGLMIEEVYTIRCAYELRTLGKRSMDIKDYCSIIGKMLLKSIDKSEKVYYAMKLRGFKGEYYYGKLEKVRFNDYIYLFLWVFILYSNYMF